MKVATKLQKMDAMAEISTANLLIIISKAFFKKVNALCSKSNNNKTKDVFFLDFYR